MTASSRAFTAMDTHTRTLRPACQIRMSGSGGAIALATANTVMMLEHSVYSVISPEGCASILWRDGAEAYLGMTVSGFPNFFMMYGPNTNIAGSIVFMLESQARYIVSAVRCLRRGGARRMTVREDVQRRFNERVQERLGRTVLVADTCHSYFQDPSGKVTTQWPGFMLEYRHRTRRLRRADYDFA